MPTGPRRAGRRISSYGDHGSGCVAVAFISDGTETDTAQVEITHSKVTDSPAMLFDKLQWEAWLGEVADEALTNQNGCVNVVVGEGLWRVTARNGIQLTYNETEWIALHAGVLAGEFDPDTPALWAAADK